MICEHVRESISAGLDGERGVVSTETVESHLRDCAACRAWRDDVQLLQRRARVTAAPLLTDETERFVGAVHAEQQRGLLGRRRLLAVQLGLVVVAVTQLVVAGPSLLLGEDAAAPEHVAHELGAFTVALAFGLLLAAWRPRLANGMVPIVGIVAALLVLTAWLDAAFNNTDIAAEWPHLLEVAGFVLLLRLAYLSNDRDWTPLLLPLRRSPRRTPSRSPLLHRAITPAPPAVALERRRAAGE